MHEVVAAAAVVAHAQAHGHSPVPPQSPDGDRDRLAAAFEGHVVRADEWVRATSGAHVGIIVVLAHQDPDREDEVDAEDPPRPRPGLGWRQSTHCHGPCGLVCS